MNKGKGMKVPGDLLYTVDHEWIRIIDGKTSVCGITDHAQNSLGDIVFVEFVANIVHTPVEQRDPIVIIESPKSTYDVYSPAKGDIVNVNRDVEDNPEIINADPYGEGWLFKIEITDGKWLNALLKPAEYLKLIQVFS